MTPPRLCPQPPHERPPAASAFQARTGVPGRRSGARRRPSRPAHPCPPCLQPRIRLLHCLRVCPYNQYVNSGRKRRAESIKLGRDIESAYAAEPAYLVEPARAAKSACPVESTDIRPCRKASLCRAATTHPPQDPVFAVTASDSLESLFAASG